MTEGTLDDAGHVTRAIATGNDKSVGACVEKTIAKWGFPCGPAEFNVPFRFVRSADRDR